MFLQKKRVLKKLKCVFISDLHGNIKRFKKLFKTIENEKPDGVFIGGDILPNSFSVNGEIKDFLDKEFFNPIKKIRKITDKNIRFFVIMGNDDPRVFEKLFMNADKKKIIDYIHLKTVEFNSFFVTGYSFVPPTPFQLKDWERYDVSRFVDVGSVSPEEGIRTVDVEKDEIRFSTISDDLEKIVKNSQTEKTIFLFHSPPYNSNLDYVGVSSKLVDHAPMDIHVGSIAIQRFIEKKQPMLTLHGHIHETVSLTGIWKEKKGKTFSFSGVSDESNFAIVFFDTEKLEKAERKIFEI
jgi:Icc-related predicted phosphoesterase